MRLRTRGTKGRDLRITFTARCSEALILGGSCWRRFGRNEVLVAHADREVTLRDATTTRAAARRATQGRAGTKPAKGTGASPKGGKSSGSGALRNSTGTAGAILAGGPQRATVD